MKNTFVFVTNLTMRFLPFAYMGLIWFFSSYPSDAIVNTGLSFDAAIKEALHLVEFGILYVLWVLALLSWDKLNPKSNNIAALFSIFYGLTDELHQYFVPSRSCNIIDFSKDAFGVITAWYIVRKILKY
jgi:hypothetical protein